MIKLSDSVCKKPHIVKEIHRRIYSFILFLIIAVSTISAQQNNFKNDIDILLLQEKYKKASELLETATSQDSLNNELFFKLGIAYKKQFLFEKAIAAFNKCIALNDSNMQAFFLLADSYAELGADQKAIPLYKLILAADSTNSAAGINLAAIHIGSENYWGAINIYEKLLKTDSLNSYLFHQLGYCYSKIDSLNKTIYYSGKALEINNNDIGSFKLLVNSHIKKGNLDEADSLTREKWEANSYNSVYNKLRGEVFFARKIYYNATFHYRMAVTEGDSSAYCYSKLGVSNYLLAANYDTTNKKNIARYNNAAKYWLEKSLAKENSPVNCYFLAMTHLKLNDYINSIVYFEKAVKLILPNIMHEIYIHKSEGFAGLKQYQDMIEALNCAYFYKKENKSILLNIAEIYEKELHDTKAALSYYTQYLDMADESDPNIVKLKQHIKSLKQSK